MMLNRKVIMILHGLLGMILWKYNYFSTYYGILIIIVGTYFIMFKSDSLIEYPLYFSAYIVGVEVLLRMSGAKLFWEFGKYAVIYFLLIGLIRSKKILSIYTPILAYYFLLVPAIIMLPLTTLNTWRQDVSFNLSGPTLLTICVLYFYNNSITKDVFSKILFLIFLPVLSMSVFNYLSMPDLSSYRFLPYSDFFTSGGYGPNQVSTVFGLGIAVVLTNIVLKTDIFHSKILNYFLLSFLISFGLITFSRGGVFAVLIAFIIAISYISFYEQNIINIFFKSFGLIIFAAIAWMSIMYITDGVISHRYGLSQSADSKNFIMDLTGRTLIYNIDLNIFSDYIGTGVGPGQASKLREEYGYVGTAAAHTEYSRMLAEHGILGFFSLLTLFFITISQIIKRASLNNKFFKIFFSILALLTMAHSAMRLAMPSFLLGFLFVKYEE